MIVPIQEAIKKILSCTLHDNVPESTDIKRRAFSIIGDIDSYADLASVSTWWWKLLQPIHPQTGELMNMTLHHLCEAFIRLGICDYEDFPLVSKYHVENDENFRLNTKAFIVAMDKAFAVQNRLSGDEELGDILDI